MLREQGYVPELDMRDPAVVPYTTLVAALAINEVILRLTGLAPSAAGQIMVRADNREIRSASREPNARHWCAQPINWGRGTQEPFLGRSVWT